MGIKNEFDLNNFKEETDRINTGKDKIREIYNKKKISKLEKYRYVFNNPKKLTDRDKLEILFLVTGIFMIGFITPLVYYNLEVGHIHVLTLGIIDLIMSQIIQKRIFEDDTKIEAEF